LDVVADLLLENCGDQEAARKGGCGQKWPPHDEGLVSEDLRVCLG
jgi:hypothetical protein